MGEEVIQPMRSLSSSTLVAVVKFAIPAAIIGYLVWSIEPAQWHQLSSQPKDYWLLLAALLVALAAMSLSLRGGVCWSAARGSS